MSKIGKRPVAIPAGVEVRVEGDTVKVKGPKGELSAPIVSAVTVAVTDGQVIVRRTGNGPAERSNHGLVRSLVNNMITGVTKGFEKRLEIIGVGYRAQATGKKITLSLGFSHPVEYHTPAGVEVRMDEENKNVVILSGIDRQKVGQAASNIRQYRPPEPYKGKGIRYVGEHVIRKAGKAAGTEK